MEKRCFACMNLLDSESTVCRHCGHDNADPDNVREQLLPPGTMIGGRYYVGVCIDRNGEGITYIAYDNEVQCRVRVREFFPDTLCHREPDRKTVLVNPGSEIQYKALMTDYVELSRQLIGITANNSLLKARDILSDFGTIYTIYEDVNAVTLTRYLIDNAGELSWEDTENLFLPLLYTVKLLNQHGIVHRGISPETILVTDRRELKLKGVCTSAVRAINTEIKPELFGGYAAPEQYEKCESHGEWTDVYAICAVLYKTLTGTMPPRADIREMEAKLIAPAELNPSVPRNVSNAIMKGLEADRAYRTLHIKDLIGGLYAASPVPERPVKSAMPPPQHIIDEEDEYEERPRRGGKKPKFRLPVWLIVILVTLPIMLILFFLAYNLILGGNDKPSSSQTSSTIVSEISSDGESSSPSSEETSSQVPQIAVDNFVGKYYDDIMKSDYYKNLFTFKEKVEKYDQDAPVGQVIDQSVEKDKIVDKGTEIELTVSKGPQFVELVPFTDASGNPISPADYQKYLSERGVESKIERIEDDFTNSGEIVRLDREIGEVIDRDQVSSVIIYVAR